MPDKILLLAEHQKNHGTGHLRRCAYLASHLRGDIDWVLPQKTAGEWYDREQALSLIGTTPHEMTAATEHDGRLSFVDHPGTYYDKIIIDRRSMTRDDLFRLPPAGMTIAIDAAREIRPCVSYLIDPLPTPPGVFRAPNIGDRGYLSLPHNTRTYWPKSFRKILIVFGGEEHDARGRRIAAGLAGDHLEIDLIAHQPQSGLESAVPCEIVPVHSGLSEELHRYDLVITHYGLTAWEAIWARVPVILVNPSAYHERLARSAGIPTARTPRLIVRSIRHPETTIRKCRSIRPAYRRNLAEHINELKVPTRVGCPSSGDSRQPAIERFPEKTYFRNSKDHLVFLQHYREKTLTYDHDYFFSEYQAQYGRTYLEDFDSIATVGARRIADILRIRGQSTPAFVLDIGCAFGPFLKAAADAGCRVCGIEINPEAVNYVREHLHLPAINLDLMKISRDTLPETPEVITMWYVIEHLTDLESFLSQIHAILPPAGLFVFSTPHGRGISARKDRRDFLFRSPDDHYSIWDIPSAHRVLRKFGFRIRKIRVTGHHPERLWSDMPKVLFPIARGVSRIFRLGDTFEVIAERL